MAERILWRVTKFIVAVTLGLALVSCAIKPGGVAPAKRIDKDAPGQFQNAHGDRHPAPELYESLSYLVNLYTSRFPGKEMLPENHVLDTALAVQQFKKARKSSYALTWFGHSTFLIKMGKLNILTDPVLGDSIGAFPFKLRRMVPVLPRWQDIEHLDVIAISHGDYDHMDVPSLRKLVRKFSDVQIIVPQGAKKYLRTLKSGQLTELPWYQSLNIGSFTLTSVPAIHSTQRPPFLTDSAHWAGYVFKHRNRSIYFSGDTGAGRVFADIRRKMGRMDVAIVPAGAYEPQDYEKHFHVTPEDAVEIARTLGAPLAIGMHWGTFSLSEETPIEQKRRFLAAAKGGTATTVFNIGETRKLF